MPQRTVKGAGADDGPDSPSSPGGAEAGRREFLARMAGLSGAGWLAIHAPALLAAGEAAAQHRVAGAGWANISAAEAATIAALVDQIIPPDDLPGAAEMGAVHFIDQALGGFLADGAEAWRAGLADLDRQARLADRAAAGFADLPFDNQTALLQQIETSPFFRQAILLTHCGLFALPAWGGNRGEAGWKLLGFDSRHAWQPPFGYYDAALYPAREAGGAAGESGHGAR